MDRLFSAAKLLPEKLRGELEAVSYVEELRLRVGRRPCLLTDEGERYLSSVFGVEDMYFAIEEATGASMRTASRQMIHGYINYHGMRVGVCGTGSYDRDELVGLRDICALDVRFPHERRGICDEAVELIDAGGYQNTVILSPPGGGKTTAVRELVRLLSGRGYRIGLADERFEIAAVNGAKAQFEVGENTDVMSGVEKSAAAIMLLRGMSPQIIAMDEITKPEDSEAVLDIVGCGVGILATAHAASANDLKKRAIYKRLFDEGVFAYALIIRGTGKNRRYETVKL